MAAFNESLNQPIIETNLSNASRGMPANEAYGDLFSGLGKTLSNVVNAYDESNQVKIEMAADAAVNGVVESNMPPALQEGIDGLNSLAEAKAQGAISEVKFLTDSNLAAKRLRSQFPEGYGPQIERAIASAAGASTANDLRKARLAEFRAAAEAGSDEMKNMREWMEGVDNSKYFLDATVQESFKALTGGMTVEQMMLNPDPAQFNKLKLAVAQRKSVDANYERVKTEIDATKMVTNQQAETVVNTVISNSFNAEINKPFGDYLQKTVAASDPNSPGGVEWTPEEAQMAAQAFTKFKIQSQRDLNTLFSETGITSDVQKNVQDRMDRLMQTYEQALTDGQLGMLNAASNAHKGRMHAAAKELIGSSDIFASIAVAKEVGVPPEVINSLFINDRNTEEMVTQLKSPAVLSIVTGKSSISNALDTISGYEKNMAPVAKGVFDRLSMILNSPVNTPEGVAAAAVQIFDKKNEDALNRIAAENRAGVFEQLMSPVVIEKLKQSGNQQAIDFAMAWGTAQFDALTKRSRDIAIDAAENRVWVDVKFDGDKFVVLPRDRTWGEFMTQLSPPNWEAAQAQEAQKAVSDLNRYMAAMKPLWESQGMDATTAMAYMMNDINKVQKNPTFLQSVGRAMWQFIGGSEAEAAIPKEGEKPGLPDKKPSEKESLNKGPASGKSIVSYANQSATRNLKLTNELESKIDGAVRTVFGEGYSVQVFSGGQPKKGSGGKRTGSIRHDEGKAADIYIVGPDGKRVTDTAVLDKLADYWEQNNLGSVGTYMRGGGIHLDEWQKEELLAGMGQRWTY